MKRLMHAVLPVALLLMLIAPGKVFAAGNTTTVEQKWLDFQKAVTDQMVKDGKMTKQDADTRMKDMKAKFAESPGDSIYEFFADKGGPGGKGGCKDGRCRAGGLDNGAFHVYSVMTGKAVDDLKSACTSGNLTIWQLAKKEGKLDALKARILAAQTASLNELVKGGVMTDEQRTKILERMKSELDKK
jgi:polyhydroxyalkanoate synthesis regulator phasin